MKLSFDDESTPVEDRKKRKKVLVGLCQHSVLCNEITKVSTLDLPQPVSMLFFDAFLVTSTQTVNDHSQSPAGGNCGNIWMESWQKWTRLLDQQLVELSKPCDLVQGPHPWCLHMCNWARSFGVRQRSRRLIGCVGNEMLRPTLFWWKLSVEDHGYSLSHDLIVCWLQEVVQIWPKNKYISLHNSNPDIIDIWSLPIADIWGTSSQLLLPNALNAFRSTCASCWRLALDAWRPSARSRWSSCGMQARTCSVNVQGG